MQRRSCGTEIAIPTLLVRGLLDLPDLANGREQDAVSPVHFDSGSRAVETVFQTRDRPGYRDGCVSCIDKRNAGRHWLRRHGRRRPVLRDDCVHQLRSISAAAHSSSPSSSETTTLGDDSFLELMRWSKIAAPEKAGHKSRRSFQFSPSRKANGNAIQRLKQ